MAGVSDSSESEVSDDDEVLSADARRRMRQENEEWIARYDSDDEGRDFEGFHASDTYTTPEFVNWSKTFSDNSRSLHEFNERVGPIRVFDGSATPLEYFQLFYSDVVFGKIADFTNGNARNKFDLAEGEGQGDGVGRRDIRTWKAVTVVELKAYYGLLFLMEVMKFDRLEMY